eukprot:5224902-Prymnesium_polylepis.1
MEDIERGYQRGKRAALRHRFQVERFSSAVSGRAFQVERFRGEEGGAPCRRIFCALLGMGGFRSDISDFSKPVPIALPTLVSRSRRPVSKPGLLRPMHRSVHSAACDALCTSVAQN